MPTPLDNASWGYESNCFVCEPANDGGMQIAFELDDERTTVVAGFTLSDTYSGAPSLVHGGASLAILDEAQAWACIAVAGKWGLTRSTAAEFVGAVFVGHPHRVEAVIEAVDDELVHTSARIIDGGGAVVVTSTAVFTVVGEVDIETGDNTVDDRVRAKILGDE